MKMLFLSVTLCLLAGIPESSRAQLSLTQPGVAATMNFDIPGTPACSGTVPWINNVTIPNCYTDKAVYAYSDGCSNTGAVHVAGTNGDMALGGRASNSTPLIIWGVRVVNNTGQAITSLHVKYRAEQWNSAQSNVSNTVAFGYRIAPVITDVTSGTYTAVPALNMTNFVSAGICGGGGSAIDGNSPAHSASLSACIAVNIPAGQEIMLRWYEPNDACNDHMMCIDDLEITPVSGVVASVLNSPVCSGDSIRLSAGPAMPGANYFWSGPAGFTAVRPDTALAPAVSAHAGRYAVLMSIPGCGAWSDTVDIVVVPLSADTLTDSICNGDSYVFSGQMLTAAGTYTDTLKSVSGCDSVIVLQLSVKTLPAMPQVKDTVRYCQFDTAAALSASGRNLLWYTTATGGTGSAVAPVPVTSDTGIKVYYVSQLPDGCESERSRILVEVRPALAGFTVHPDPVCAEDTATIVFTGNAPLSSVFSWDWDGGTVHAGAGAGPYRISWSAPGMHSLRLQLDNNGCLSRIDTVEVLVRRLPVAHINAPVAICQGDVVSLSATGGPIASWYYGDAVPEGGRTANTAAIRLSWSSDGEKAVGLSVTDGYGCTSPVTYDTIRVHPLPEARIINQADERVCANDTVELKAVQMPGYRYQWEPANQVAGDPLRPSALLLLHDTAFQARLTVTDENNCSASDGLWINVVPCCDVYMPNAFTPNGDGRNDIFRAIAKGPQPLFDFRIFNRWGNPVFSSISDTKGWDGTFHGAPSEAGTYYYLLRYECEGEERMLKGEVLLIR